MTTLLRSRPTARHQQGTRPELTPWPPAAGWSGRIIVLIPARNEADRVASAVQALSRQTRPPDQVIVVANNCTDNTLQAARQAGAWAIDLPQCPGKKAGALNIALDTVLPTLQDSDTLLVQDADTVLNPLFIETALDVLMHQADVGAVGGVFYGDPGGGLLGHLQRMEYRRYAWEISRKGGKASVLSGTATLFRVVALREIKQARKLGAIGGGNGYYSLASLTEDDEITKAIKTVGYRTVSPDACTVTTEVMTNLPALWHQRCRWQRGALENLRSYGLNRVTLPYFGQQLMMGIGALSLLAYLLFVTLLLAAGNHLSWSPFWSSIGLIFLLEKTISVKKAGWRSVALATLMIPELLYDMFQHAVYFRSLYDLARRREERWIST